MHPNLRNARLGLLAAAALAVAACGGGSGGGGSGPDPDPTTPITRSEAYRFLNQATFGATPAEADRLIALGDSQTGYQRWIDDQLCTCVVWRHARVGNRKSRKCGAGNAPQFYAAGRYFIQQPALSRRNC